MTPSGISKTVFNERYDEVVLLRDIEFHSLCEHHLLPFTGRAHVAYLPDGKVVGLSKLARLVEGYARRPQVQERLTTQIADALMEELAPIGAACVIEATHTCMTIRGAKKPGSRHGHRRAARHLQGKPVEPRRDPAPHAGQHGTLDNCRQAFAPSIPMKYLLSLLVFRLHGLHARCASRRADSPGSDTDKGWNQMAKEGLDQIKKELKAQTKAVTNVKSSDFSQPDLQLRGGRVRRDHLSRRGVREGCRPGGKDLS